MQCNRGIPIRHGNHKRLQHHTCDTRQGERLFCSRPVADPLAPCSISCPAPGLTFNTGHAYVDSTYTIPTCANIAVDAQEVFTRDPADSLIESMSRLSIVKLNQPSIGD